MAESYDLNRAIQAARSLGMDLWAHVELIAAAAGMTGADIRGPGRTREVVEVRRVVAHYMRGQGLTLPAIGRYLGRDHTTVLNLLSRPPRQPDQADVA